MLNLRKAAEKTEPDTGAAENYLRLSGAVVRAYRLAAWGRLFQAEAIRKPEIDALDPGLAARLLRLTREKPGRSEVTVLTGFAHPHEAPRGRS